MAGSVQATLAASACRPGGRRAHAAAQQGTRRVGTPSFFATSRKWYHSGQHHSARDFSRRRELTQLVLHLVVLQQADPHTLSLYAMSGGSTAARLAVSTTASGWGWPKGSLDGLYSCVEKKIPQTYRLVREMLLTSRSW